MAKKVTLLIELPPRWRKSFPPGLTRRLHDLLDKNNEGTITRAERQEAGELVELTEILSLARLQAEARRKDA